MVNDELQHHGIKGMRWGVRRKRTSSPKPKRVSKRQKKKEALEVLEASKKRSKQWRSDFNKRAQLSDAELKKRVDRLRLENEFDRLSKEAIKDIPKKKKGLEQIKKLSNMKIPKFVKDDDDNLSLSNGTTTIGDIVADQALKQALNYVNNTKKKTAAS